jgi:DNA-binding transcriptional ArsR family regulator
MAENITREELLEELCNAYSGLDAIREDEFTAREIADAMGMHETTLMRHISSGKIPSGWEVVVRRGNRGQPTKCLRKIKND